LNFVARLTDPKAIHSMTRVTLGLPRCLSSTVLPVLGQSNDPGEVFVWSFILIMLLVGGLMAALYLKKWMAKEDAPDDDEGGFTLGDLRRLHQNGKLTTEEFEKAKTQMIAATQRAANRAAEAAAEAAKKQQGGVTDIDQLRARAAKRKEIATPPPVPKAEGPDEAAKEPPPE
jgi:hypothetical protein